MPALFDWQATGHIRPGRHFLTTAHYNIRRDINIGWLIKHISRRYMNKRIQPFQPEAGCFLGSITEVIRLHNLIWLSVYARHYPYRVFNTRFRYMIQGSKKHEKIDTFLLPAVLSLGLEMTRTRYAYMSAWREGYTHIPIIENDIHYIALDMPFRVFA